MTASAISHGPRSIVIGDMPIGSDASGRYSLNDLHAASGGQKRHGPSYWLANIQTKELIAELETTGIPVVAVPGRNGGTFVAKELVYAYAMWISATFHLKVIRAYDTLVQSDSFAIPKTLGAALRLAADQQDEIERQAIALQAAAPAIAHHAAVAKAENDLTMRQMAVIIQQHGHKTGRNRFMETLRLASVLGRAGTGYNLPTQRMCERGYFHVVESTRPSKSDPDKTYADHVAYVTGKGHNWLIDNYAKLVERAEAERKRIAEAKKFS